MHKRKEAAVAVIVKFLRYFQRLTWLEPASTGLEEKSDIDEKQEFGISEDAFTQKSL